jgi:putative PIG3 family NAD(P)H quinone oxidoreductase
MRAIVITAAGGPEVLQLRDVPLPALPPGHIRVRVQATALNRADLLQRRGLYPAPVGAPTDIPGLEYAGEVEAVAPAVTHWRPGDRVMGLVGGGGYAEYVQVHQDEALPVPARLSFADAAAVPEAFLTAHDALATLMQLKAGERVLIHAAASGVGTAAIQLARALATEVYATSRTRRKLEAVSSLGIDYPIDTSEQDFAAAIERHTNGGGVNGVLDLVGGNYLTGNLRCLAQRGRLILVGLTAGSVAQLDMRAVLRKRLTIVGTVMRARALPEKIAVAAAFAREALPLLESGVLRPVIDRVLPMEQVQEAHRLMEANETIGKIVLSWKH